MNVSDAMPIAPGAESAPPGRRRWRYGGSLALGWGLSALFMYLAGRQVQWGDLWTLMLSARLAPLLALMGATAVSSVLRAVRWKALLGEPAPALRPCFTSMMIGYLGNNVLPVRMGELMRLYALERNAAVRKSRAAASIVLERGIDGLCLVMVMAVLSLLLPLPPLVRQALVVSAPLFVGLVLLLAALSRGNARVAGALTQVAGCFSPRLGRFVGGVMERAGQGLSILHGGATVWRVLALTLAIWSLEAAAVMVAATSLSLSLPWAAAWLVTAMLGLGAVIPAAPGGIGTYEFLAVSALTAFAVEPGRALGFALLLHVVTYGTSTGLGVGSLAAESWSMRNALRKVHDV